MDNEEPFTEEARQEAVLSRTKSAQRRDASKNDDRAGTAEDLSDDESSPLMDAAEEGPRRRQPYNRGKSYQKAIDEPWTGAHGSGGRPWYKKPSILWLLPAFFPYCVAFGGLIVPKTYLILNLICKDYLASKSLKDPGFTFIPIIFNAENPQCRDPNVQSLVARFNLYMNLLAGFFAAIVSPQLGALSDRIGRKRVLVFASFGSFVMELITIFVGNYPDKVSVYWILLGSLADGLCGSITTAMALSFAYAADCTSPERRNVAFGFFHATLFAGVALGPVLSGILIEFSKNIMLPFYVALGCHVLFILFIAFVIPESLSKERQLLAREKRSIKNAESPHKTWFQVLKNYNVFEPLWILRPIGPGTSPQLRRNLFVLASIDTMMFGVAMGTMQIILIYCEYRFGWSAVDAAKFLSTVNVCRVAGLALLLPLLSRVFRGPVSSHSAGHRGSDMVDINIIRVSIVFDLLGYVGYALTPSGALMVVSGVIASVGGIGSPILQASMTKHIPADRTGQVLGASGLLHALARVVAPTIFNLIYSATVGTYAGLVFICLASVFVLVFIMSWFLKPNVFLEDATVLGTNKSDPEDIDEHEALVQAS